MTTEAARRHAPALVCLLPGLSLLALVLGSLAEEGLLIWGAGSLSQNGWHDAAFLAPRLLLGGAYFMWGLGRR
ncbi:hypothetical protein [Halomonas sp. Y3]|uniref:hypothetical protein n=1 Tax=Halomonas sp. Y3 TaxID=2956797 RepID=UPI00209CAC28|nr:hypothetical protein [Halomonas sp. Y3]